MKPPPAVAIIMGVLIMAGTAYGLLEVLVLHPIRPLSGSDIKVISGKVTSIQEVRESPKSTGLDVTLEGQPYPFRLFGGLYPKLVDKAALAQATSGQMADVGVNLSESSPRLNRETNQNFIPVVSLHVGGWPVLPIDSYNKWQLENRSASKLVIPTFFLLGCYVTFQGVRGRRLGLSHTPGMF